MIGQPIAPPATFGATAAAAATASASTGLFGQTNPTASTGLFGQANGSQTTAPTNMDTTN